MLSDKVTHLTEVVRESDLTADEVLAFLAYASHGKTQLLMEAREAGAELGAVGPGAYRLRDRIKDQLT